VNIYKANHDKPHRCPVCWHIPDRVYDKDGYAHFFRIYKCQRGHRFTRLPIPGRRDLGWGDSMTLRDEFDNIVRRIQRKLGRRW
jgi:hypothetical protein